MVWAKPDNTDYNWLQVMSVSCDLNSDFFFQLLMQIWKLMFNGIDHILVHICFFFMSFLLIIIVYNVITFLMLFLLSPQYIFVISSLSCAFILPLHFVICTRIFLDSCDYIWAWICPLDLKQIYERLAEFLNSSPRDPLHYKDSTKSLMQLRSRFSTHY